ncbi:MAG: DMT family transporter [Spirochaetales bacterium]|nr:MAG: DMT family transporter [Spirochaetales bacterium]
MNLSEILLFILLSAIWGSSFIFMRILSPVLGPLTTTGLRLFIAGLFLVVFFLFKKHKLEWRRFWKQYLFIGVVNSAIPFSLLSFAALHQSASVSAIINSLAPIWAALFSVILLKERLTAGKIGGLVLGIAGVAVISVFGKHTETAVSLPGAAACVLAAVCYGFGGTWIKKYGSSIPPKSIAAGSQLASGVLFLPYMIAAPPAAAIRADIVLYVLVFSLMCSAFAYLIYYRILSSAGPTRALAVTYVVPVFGFLWARIFLKESITWPMIAGGAVIFAGIFLISKRKRMPGTRLPGRS